MARTKETKHVHITGGNQTALCGYNLGLADKPAWISPEGVTAWRSGEPIDGVELCQNCEGEYDRGEAPKHRTRVEPDPDQMNAEVLGTQEQER